MKKDAYFILFEAQGSGIFSKRWVGSTIVIPDLPWPDPINTENLKYLKENVYKAIRNYRGSNAVTFLVILSWTKIENVSYDDNGKDILYQNAVCKDKK